jgi:hypothetical protein
MTDQAPPIAAVQADKNTTDKKTITLTVGQAITVFSVALGSVMTIAYAIASFLQTKYIVDELKRGSDTVQADIRSLRDKTQNLSVQIDTTTVHLSQLIKDNCNPRKQ